MKWKDDSELFALIKEQLFTAVVGDIMDTLGLLHQFLPPEIRPLKNDMILAGRAMTVLEEDIDRNDSSKLNSDLGKPFGLMLEALDDLRPNEIYICTGASPNYALWGELMSTRAAILGSTGAVLDGHVRDTHGILKLGFPTFSMGPYARDQGPRGKVIDFRCAIQMKGVQILPGDIVFGDIDGVCVIPQSAEDEVIRKALEKANGEKLVAKAIRSGMSACDAFDKFGIM